MSRRVLQGTVESAKNNKTVLVRVERVYIHPLYKKTVKKSTKYAAHDENNLYKVGDKIRIEECRPISKTKNWVVLDKDH